jgi:pyridoxal biosynthesis lyase PdxS
MNAVKEYDARIDLKKRVTIRGAHYDHYHVTEFADGRIVLEPRELVVPFELSKRSLTMMDASMVNFKDGKVSTPVDLSALADME